MNEELIKTFITRYGEFSENWTHHVFWFFLINQQNTPYSSVLMRFDVHYL